MEEAFFQSISNRLGDRLDVTQTRPTGQNRKRRLQMSDDSALTTINSVTVVQGFRGEATSTDAQRAEVKRSNEKQGQKDLLKIKQVKEEREKYSREMVGLQDKRRHGACLGLGVMIKRLRRENRHVQADILAGHLLKCQAHLDDLGQAQIKQAKGYDKPMDTLAEKSAKAITKLLPSGVFTDTAEAVEWCKRYLPLTEARNEQTRNIDKWSGCSKAITKANRAFWDSFDRGVSAGNGLDCNAIIAIGLERLED
jgi:hypothetical protein